MAHRRKPLGLALGLNTGVLLLETLGGLTGNSLTLLMDAVHNLSDELGLLFLFLAYALRAGLSGHFLRSANLFNSAGLLAISALLIWQAVDRLSTPQPVSGLLPVVVGLLAAAGNWAVARTLREPGREDVAIRLAYAHNLGDTLFALTPVLAELGALLLRSSLVDPIVALLLGLVLLLSTIKEIAGASAGLVWPTKVVCR